MSHRPVLTKRDFVKRYAAGEFGNASPTWDNYQEWANAHGWQHGNLFHIRNRIIGETTWYDVPVLGLRFNWYRACELVPAQLLYISAMAPTEKTLFQGEVQRGLWGYDLTYTTVAKPMRDALQQQTYVANGIIAKLLLEHYLCSRSYEWLEYLLEEYPGHVIEFSTYSVEWGTVLGYNTVFWEIRRY